MLGLSRNEGIDRMTDALAAFRREVMVAVAISPSSSTSSGGVAQFPADGDTLEALDQAADEALDTAKSSGRNQVTAARSADGSAQQTVDVAVIEDDDATANSSPSPSPSQFE